MESGDSGKDIEKDEISFFFVSFQSESELSSISCQGRFDWDFGISTTEFCLVN